MGRLIACGGAKLLTAKVAKKSHAKKSKVNIGVMASGGGDETPPRQPPGRRRYSNHYLFRDAVFFVLRAQYAVDGVGGAVAGFVVVADLHFAQQADGEQVQSA